MPARLALCDLGAPGWGEHWFPHSAVLLYTPGYGDVCDVCVFGSAFALTAIPMPAMIQGYHAYSLPRSHNWSAGHFSPSRFVLCCVFWFVLLVCFCSLVLFCFSVFVL